MSDSVRLRLIKALATRIAASVDRIGKVTVDGEVLTDAGENQRDLSLTDVLAGKKCVVDLVVGGDDIAGGPTSVDAFELPLGLTAYLPDSLPAGFTSATFADEIAQVLYQAYMADPQLGGLAVDCRCDSFQNGPYASPEGPDIIIQLVTVQYRFPKGSPTQAI